MLAFLIICLGNFMMKINGIELNVGDIFNIKYKNNILDRYVIKQIKDEDIELSAILNTRKKLYKNFKKAKLKNPDSYFLKQIDLKSDENYSFFVGKEFFNRGIVMKEIHYEMTYKIGTKKSKRIFCSAKKTEKESYKFMNEFANKKDYDSFHIYKISSDRLSFLRNKGFSVKYIYENESVNEAI